MRKRLGSASAAGRAAEPPLPAAILVALLAVFDAWSIYGVVQRLIWALT